MPDNCRIEGYKAMKQNKLEFVIRTTFIDLCHVNRQYGEPNKSSSKGKRKASIALLLVRLQTLVLLDLRISNLRRRETKDESFLRWARNLLSRALKDPSYDAARA